MMTQTAIFVASAVYILVEADGFGRCTLKDAFSRVLQQQNRSAASGEAIACRRGMATQDVHLIDPCISEKPVGRFGACPVLTRQRDA